MAAASAPRRTARASAALPWEDAWQEALYGPNGFYRVGGGPAAHFTTSAHGPAGAVFAQALLALADGAGLRTIVDFAAGRGELSTRLAEAAATGGSVGTGGTAGSAGSGRLGGAASRAGGPARPEGAVRRVIAVDVVPRPSGLDGSVEWMSGPGGPSVPDLRPLGPALVVANEWLDVVPCPVVAVDARGETRLVLIDRAGGESLGDPPDDHDAAWLAKWWPDPGRTPERGGHRAEVGRSRDAAYAALVAAAAPGSLVVAIDYGHTRATRPLGGSLVGYRGGAQVAPVPDGTCDLTAHVAMDSLGADRLLTQRDALRELGLDGERPSYDLSRTDPMAYLEALSRASAASALTRPGLGDFWWAITSVTAPQRLASLS